MLQISAQLEHLWPFYGHFRINFGPSREWYLKSSLRVRSGKRWFGVYHSILYISFPWQYIFAFYQYYDHIYFTIPYIKRYIFYQEYWIPKWWLLKDKKIYRFCYCKCTFICFNLCMISNFTPTNANISQHIPQHLCQQQHKHLNQHLRQHLVCYHIHRYLTNSYKIMAFFLNLLDFKSI